MKKNIAKITIGFVILGIVGMMGIFIYNQNQYLKQLCYFEWEKDKTEQRPVEEMRQFNGIVDCNGVELKMVKIKAGSFMMGSPDTEKGRTSSEKQHHVTLTKDYWMGQYEVTPRLNMKRLWVKIPRSLKVLIVRWKKSVGMMRRRFVRN